VAAVGHGILVLHVGEFAEYKAERKLEPEL
jgi:hypothetical protein